MGSNDASLPRSLLRINSPRGIAARDSGELSGTRAKDVEAVLLYALHLFTGETIFDRMAA